MSDRELLRRLSRPSKVSVLAAEARTGTFSSSDMNELLDILSAGPSERTGLARAVIEVLASEGVPNGRLADLRVAFGLTDSVRLSVAPVLPASPPTPLAPPAADPPAVPARPTPPAYPAAAGRPGKSSVLETRTVKLAFRAQFEDVVAAPPAKTSGTQIFPAGGGLARRTVLIADDDKAVRAEFREALQKAGFNVMETADGQQASQLLQLQAISALVMEMKLPGMHGLDLLTQLAASGRKIPVVVCTAHTALKNEVVVASYPNLRFLTKRVDPRILVDTLTMLLAQQA